MTKSLVVLDSRGHMRLTNSRLRRSQLSVSRISLWGGRPDGWLSDGLGRVERQGGLAQRAGTSWCIIKADMRNTSFD